MKLKIKHLTVTLPLLAFSALNSELSRAYTHGTAFTYQGVLQSNTTPVDGLYDFQIKMYFDNQAGSTLPATAMPGRILPPWTIRPFWKKWPLCRSPNGIKRTMTPTKNTSA